MKNSKLIKEIVAFKNQMLICSIICIIFTIAAFALIDHDKMIDEIYLIPVAGIVFAYLAITLTYKIKKYNKQINN